MAANNEPQPLRAAPRRYKKLFDMLLAAMPSSFLLIDRNLRVANANNNFLQKNRKQRAKVIGARVQDVLPQPIVEKTDIVKQIRWVQDNNKPIRGKRMTYRAPGIPIRVYYYSILPFSWGGNVECTILLMDDVTEQIRLSGEVRRVERHLASVVESATDIVLSADSDGRVLSWNAAAEKLSGFKYEDVQNEPFFGRCADDHRGDMEGAFKILKAKKTSRTGEWDLISKSGQRIPVSWVFSPMENETGSAVGLVAVGRDLSERRKLEKQLLQSQKLAALGVMAGGIAHEIRNPLAICSSAAQFLMREENVSPFARECIDKILASIQRASGIIENLLRFARPAPTSDLDELDLMPIIHESVRLIDNLAKIQKVNITVDSDEPAALVQGNSNLLRQVFLNLFLNALNAMPEGGTLSVSISRMDREIVLRVADTGQGIPREYITNIFDPFFTTSPVGKGSGLGLSICYSVVKQHFGTIEVQSSEEKGTVFTVRLPALR
jgi:PAS domain S-box-containing protein